MVPITLWEWAFRPAFAEAKPRLASGWRSGRFGFAQAGAILRALC
jgi:hypothetical protein